MTKRYEKKGDKVSLKGLRVLVLNGAAKESIISMLASHGAKRAISVQLADLVVFTGGTDVNPKLYGEKPTQHTPYWDEVRDTLEISVFKQCREWDVPMLGICRGSQFLHVMNGGKLWQHVEGHCGSHDILDLARDVVVKATSTHHQMWRVNPNMELIAVANPNNTKTFHREAGVFHRGELWDFVEPEVAFYPETQTLIIQGHPEFDLGGPYESYCMDVIYDTLQRIYSSK